MGLIVTLLMVFIGVILARFTKALTFWMLIRGNIACIIKHLIQFSFVQPYASAGGAIIYFDLISFRH